MTARLFWTAVFVLWFLPCFVFALVGMSVDWIYIMQYLS
jgi:hypothetical protein